MRTNFFFNLKDIKPLHSYAGGNLTCVTNKEVPGFENISLAVLKLNTNACTEPLWHNNAHKIGWCQQGKAQITLRDPEGLDVFTVEEGDVFFIPQGYLHFVRNIGNQECIVVFALNTTQPKTMHLTNAVRSLSDPVFSATFNSPNEFLKGLKKDTKEERVKILRAPVQNTDYVADRHRFNIKTSNKAIQTKGGYLQLATKTNLPLLEGLAILGFGLNNKGCVEPHWHTNAGELVYIYKGKARMTVLSPEGKLESAEIAAGQGMFAPASYFHSIENIGDEDVGVIAFFTNAAPDYIGINEALNACPNDLLASCFNVDPRYFDNFKKSPEPLVIVPV